MSHETHVEEVIGYEDSFYCAAFLLRTNEIDKAVLSLVGVK